jgi:hypothetical protein
MFRFLSTRLKSMSITGLVLIGLFFVMGIVAVGQLAGWETAGIVALLPGVPFVFGTTLAANEPRKYGVGLYTNILIIASDIVYSGAAVGDNGAGYGRPLVAGDKFLGFADAKVDNSSGSAGDKDIRCFMPEFIQLAVSGAVITDVGQPVYASDDNTFTFVAVSNSLIGHVSQWVSSGVVIVKPLAEAIDDFGAREERETKSANYTMDAEDVSKIIYIDTDAFAITLPATVVGYKYTFVNAGAFGAVAINISPDANDKIMGPDIGGTNNKDLINTKTTARRGDFVTILADGVDGWMVTDIKGTWAEEG